MSLFEETLADLKHKKSRKESGKPNGIPFPFSRFREYITDIEPGSYIGLLAASGVGKSKLSRFITIYSAIDYSIKNDYPIKVIYFALEDEKKKVMKNIICHYLLKRHGYKTSLWYLESKGDYTLSNEALHLIENDKAFFEQLGKILLIVDDCLSPNEIESKCDLIQESLKNSEIHVLCVVDNYANIIPDETQDEWTAVRYFSRNIVRLKLCKKYNWTVFGILQQDVDTEKNIFRMVASGKSSAASVEPNGSSISNVKVLIRDFYYAIGLFNPWKYEIEKYPNHKGYDISILRNKVRFINLFKSNESEVGGRLGIYFGDCETFTELPHILDEVEVQNLYQHVITEEKEKRQKYVNKNLFS